MRFNILNGLGVDLSDRRTDRQTQTGTPLHKSHPSAL